VSYNNTFDQDSRRSALTKFSGLVERQLSRPRSLP
jgi:hypothetical protein